jgi:hypothetical protein
MAGGLTEDALVEQPAMKLLRDLGWDVASGFDEVLGPAGTLGRDSQAEVVLSHRLPFALRSINPGIPRRRSWHRGRDPHREPFCDGPGSGQP